MTEGKRRSNLERMMADLRHYAATQEPCQVRLESPDPLADRMVVRMPLAHSRSPRGFKSALAHGRLLSKVHLDALALRRLDPIGDDRVEASLGTADCVFTYAGPFRYPQNQACGLLFLAGVEGAAGAVGTATPFDSGGLVDYLRPADSDEERRDFLRSHEMPVPAYRRYFQLFVTALFGSPWDYLIGVGPDHRGPLDLVGGDSRAWTFEVRFERELRVPDGLLAVLVPAAVIDSEWAAPHLVAWKRAGIDVQPYIHGSDGLGKDLLEAGVQYMRGYLG